MEFKNILVNILQISIVIIAIVIIYMIFNSQKTDKIPILTFHRIVPNPIKKEKSANDEWVASVQIFEEQMKYLYDNGYKTISADEFYAWYKGECDFPKKTVMITLDDGNLDDFYIVLPILKKYNFKATSFIVGNRVKEDRTEYDPNKRTFITKYIINETKNIYPNLKYESHSYNMHIKDTNKNAILHSYSREQILDDFEQNSKFQFKYFAYPYGEYNEEIISVLEEKRIQTCFYFSLYNKRRFLCY